MNIFYIDEDPKEVAKAQVDKHCVKMPLESAQMLSTAHRLLDGTRTPVAAGKKKKKVLFLLPDETWSFDSAIGKFIIHNSRCYNVAHAKHPSTVWTMTSKENYEWHSQLFAEMLKEYTARYGKQHRCEALLPILKNAPKNIQPGKFTPPTPAMPDKYKRDDVLESYRLYYAGDKWRFSKWKHGIMPPWLPHYMKVVWDDQSTDRRSIIFSAANRLKAKKSIPMDQRIFSFGASLCIKQEEARQSTI